MTAFYDWGSGPGTPILNEVFLLSYLLRRDSQGDSTEVHLVVSGGYVGVKFNC